MPYDSRFMQVPAQMPMYGPWGLEEEDEELGGLIPPVMSRFMPHERFMPHPPASFHRPPAAPITAPPAAPAPAMPAPAMPRLATTAYPGQKRPFVNPMRMQMPGAWG